MAAGRPIAINITGDLGRTVVDERIGIATEDSPEAFAQGIQDLLEDDTLRQKMGRRASQLAEGRLSRREIAKTFGKLYEELPESESDVSVRSFAK